MLVITGNFAWDLPWVTSVKRFKSIPVGHQGPTLSSELDPAPGGCWRKVGCLTHSWRQRRRALSSWWWFTLEGVRQGGPLAGCVIFASLYYFTSSSSEAGMRVPWREFPWESPFWGCPSMGKSSCSPGAVRRPGPREGLLSREAGSRAGRCRVLPSTTGPWLCRRAWD